MARRKSYPNQANAGLFVPSTYVWDVGAIYATDVNTPEFKELLVRLYLNLNRMAIALNLKDSAHYALSEFVNGQVFFPNPNLSSTTAQAPTLRQVFRKVINFGALGAAAGTTSIPHGIDITSDFSFTRIYAVANDPVNFVYLPIPYASSTAADIIELNVDADNVNITVGKDRSSFTKVYCILEFIKS